jgi:hypothetical protein
MSSEHPISPDITALAKLLAKEQANAVTIAFAELLEALTPGQKVRNEAAQRSVIYSAPLEQSTAGVPRPQQIFGRGITEQRSRVTIWCATAAVVYIATDRGQCDSAATRIQLIPLVPIVLVNQNEVWAQSPDAAAVVNVILEEFDAA